MDTYLGHVHAGDRKINRIDPDSLNRWNEGGLLPGIVIADLKRWHRSRPRNELLADVFFKAGMIEAWGRGTVKIVDECKKAGLPEPEFREEFGGLSVRFRKAPVGEKWGEKVGESGEKAGRKWGEIFAQSETKILNAIAAEPYITINGLSEKIGIGTTAVENNLKKLKSKGAILRVGPAKGGYWKINI
jgi:ATP-dependent DNA helicase RecG